MNWRSLGWRKRVVATNRPTNGGNSYRVLVLYARRNELYISMGILQEQIPIEYWGNVGKQASQAAAGILAPIDLTPTSERHLQRPAPCLRPLATNLRLTWPLSKQALMDSGTHLNLYA